MAGLVTFSKRRFGIYRKATELVTSIGAEIVRIHHFFTPGGKPFSFDHPSFEHVINRFLEGPSNIDSTQALWEAYGMERGLKSKS
ncbi:unnamed protein product [Dovyalis caffra]|uniref:MADS-box domain-containing protein n=1 Tax=Dovyalis caffra TaxID=77055 RepID=A0AAV1RCA1_9ROSI|nr:unnamed protein product [Dovyalis caffra]